MLVRIVEERLILGLASLTGAIVVLIDPYSIAAALSVFALIGFHLLIGARLMSVTRGAA